MISPCYTSKSPPNRESCTASASFFPALVILAAASPPPYPRPSPSPAPLPRFIANVANPPLIDGPPHCDDIGQPAQEGHKAVLIDLAEPTGVNKIASRHLAPKFALRSAGLSFTALVSFGVTSMHRTLLAGIVGFALLLTGYALIAPASTPDAQTAARWNHRARMGQLHARSTRAGRSIPHTARPTSFRARYGY